MGHRSTPEKVWGDFQFWCLKMEDFNETTQDLAWDNPAINPIDLLWNLLAVRRWLWGTPGVVASLGYAGIAVQPRSGANLLIDIPKGFHWWSGSCLKCSRFRRCRLRISSNPSGSRSASTLAVTSYIFKGIRPTVRIWSKNMLLKTFFLRSSSCMILYNRITDNNEKLRIYPSYYYCALRLS